MHRYWLATVLTLVALGGLTPAQAQYSEKFQREAASLRVEASQLLNRRVDLQLRQEARDRQAAALKARAAEINALPAGVARDAAAAQWRRDAAAWQERRDQLAYDIRKFNDDSADYKARKTSLERRRQAALEANAFRPGDSVYVEWRGDWWSARVLRAESGSYYIAYSGYGSEWNEWVGSDRIRRR